jgi:SAM-dependent methyltransferase
MSKYNDNFINVKLTPKTLYIYSVRRALQKAIDMNIDLFWGILLDLGCGEMPYRQYLLDMNKNITKYIGVDVRYNQYHHSVKPDIIWNGETIDIENEEINTVIATELFEHLSNIEVVLREIKRVLSENGILFFTVPFIWPLHETPYDEYRYTPFSLQRILKTAGFRNLTITPLGGYNAALAQMISIWIVNYRNTITSSFKRKLFNKIEKDILYFIIKRLLKKDEELWHGGYGENTMPTGFVGYAKK